MKTLLLFDIDGTLILNSNAGIVSYLNSIKRRHNILITQEEIPLSCGKTDFIIIRELLDYAGLFDETERDPEFLKVYLAELQKALKLDPGALAPGIPGLLGRLAQEDEFILALGTGNIRDGAFLKLACHGLDRYFLTGGFAEDGATRSQVIATAVTRTERLYDVKCAKVVVIGDTPHDVKCAQDNGFYSVAVTTGNFSREDLASYSPDTILADLGDYDSFIQFIKGLD